MRGVHSLANQPEVTGAPSSRRLATGTICSPISMPKRPISAMAGGAGERTLIRPYSKPASTPAPSDIRYMACSLT